MIVHLLNKKRIIALLIVLFCGIQLTWAYAPDFSKQCSSGQTLYYAIIDAANRYVAFTSPGGNNYSSMNDNGWQNYTKPTGNITLPSTVYYNGTTYTVTKVGSGAFWDCTGLTGTLTIPSTVTEIEYGGFRGCCGFTSLNLSNVEIIGPAAFYKCYGLTGDLTIPNTTTYLGNTAFACCSFSGTLTIGSSVEYIDSTSPFLNFCALYDGSYIDNQYAYNDFSTIVVNAYNTVFDSRNNCNAIIRTSDNTLVYGHKNTTIPNTVTSIAEYAFDGCLGLTSIEIPNSVTSIASSAFYNCVGLTEVSVMAETPPTIQSSSFSGVDKSIPVKVPCGTWADYHAANYWSEFVNLQELGTINGHFSVGEAVYVNFSQGNLQYQASTNTWRFAEKQWDYVGSSNSSASSTYSGWIDLFGWGTSGYNHGATNYRPWNTTTTNSHYYAYGSATYNLFDQTGKADWGYNAIYSGCDTENDGWRTLTNAEWQYVFNTRSTTSGIRYAKAKVNNISGVILLPDDWQSNYYSLSNTNSASASFTSNTITASQWSALEQHGAVFLPAAGYRNGTTVNSVGSYGYYWSSTYASNTNAYGPYFYASSHNAGYSTNRYYGRSVRLVRPIQSCVINASPNSTQYGQVSGAGAYMVGSNCTLTATPRTGYHFVNWTENGTVVSSNASYSFTVNRNRTLVANFSINTYSITATASPTEGGTVSGAGTYNHGSSCTLTATPSSNYSFYRWTKNGSSVSYYSSSYTIYSVTESASYVAEFTKIQYYISAQASPTAGGTVTGSGSYEIGSTVTLTATPATGYSFVNWTKNGTEVSTNATYSFTATASDTYVANFSMVPYTITTTANPNNGGTVVSFSDVVNNSFEDNTIPSEWNNSVSSYPWTIWSSNPHGGSYCIASSNYHISNSESYIEATVDFVEDGSVDFYSRISSESVDYDYGCFYIDGTQKLKQGGTSNTWTSRHYEVVAGTHTFRWYYQKDGSDDRGEDRYFIDDITFTGCFSESVVFYYGGTCKVRATANNHYTFQNWTENGSVVSTDTTYTFTVTGDRALVANFSPDSYTITASANPTVGGTVSGAGTYEHGSSCTLTATPATGYTFTNWKKDNTVVSTNASYLFTVTEAATYTATFTINSYAITASADPTNGGTVMGAGNYNHGTQVTLTATPSVGYHFVNWTKGNTQVSTSPTYSFTATQAGAFVAHFELNSYTLSINYKYADGTQAAPTHTESVNYNAAYNVASPVITGYTADQLVVSGTMGADDVTVNVIYNVNSYTLTVNYLYADGTTAAATHTESVNYNATYSVNSPDITGYTADLPVVTGTMGTENVTVDVTYNINAYTLTVNYLYADGTTAATTHTENVNYNATYSVNSPDITGYTADLPVVTGTMGTENVTVDVTYNINAYTLTVNYLYADGTTAAATHTESVNYNASYSVNSPDITGYTADLPVVTGTMGTENVTVDVTYNINTYTLTVNYLYADGTTAAATHTENVNYNATYSVNSPDITGYTADLPVVTGTMGTENVTVDVTYNINTYTLTVNYLYADGTTAAATHTENVNYNATYSVNSPDISGYTADLPVVTGTMGTENITVDVTYTINSYAIAVSANPSIGGSVTGDGNYDYGTSVVLTASPAEGYSFVSWTENDEVVSTSATYSFTVTEARTLMANFSLNSYEIIATADPTTGGTVTGAGSYNHFENCTLTATTATGYTFVNWTENGNEVSTDATYSFSVTEPRDLVAHFSLNSYEITASANPSIGGTVTGDGTYNHFETCTLTATADEGYTFVNWTENGVVVSTGATYSFTVTEARTLMANFSLNSYVVTATANPSIGGTVTGSGTYNHGETVTLTATARNQYTFVSWTENGEVVSTDNTYIFEVTSQRNLVANFESLNYHWTQPTMSGNMTLGGIVIIDGTLQSADYLELGAFCGNECRGRSLPQNLNGMYIYFLMVAGNNDGDLITFRLYDHHQQQELDLYSTSTLYFQDGLEFEDLYEFTFISRVAITATADPESYGTVAGSGNYFPTLEATLTATPNTGYSFVNWTCNGEAVSTDASYTFTVAEAANYVAHFIIAQYDIMATANPDEGGSINGSGTYEHGQTCTLTATANEGYTFVNWTENGEVVSTDASYDFTVTGARTLMANFSLNSYEITATADPTVGGSIVGNGTYNYLGSCTLTATANEGYTFINWTEEGEVVSTIASFSFTVTGNRALMAHFILNSYEIMASADPAAGGIIMGTGTYNHSETCTLTATANEGYTFVNWTENGMEVCTSASYDFTVTGSRTLIANFSLNSYEIVATANPTEGGAIAGAGTYGHFETCTLTATANEGYQFNSWVIDGTVVSNNSEYSFMVSGPIVATAVFDLAQTVAMSNGWTWWGTSVELSNIDGLTMLENSLGDNGKIIKNSTDFVQNYNTQYLQGWQGSLTSLNNETGYKVKTSAACEVTMVGPSANPEDHPITLNSNWTWIGYPVSQSQTVVSALGNYQPSVNDVIKGQGGYATYLPDVGWMPQYFTLDPGHSYLYYSMNSESQTLVYANGRGDVPVAEPDSRHWRNDIHAFADNLCLMAVVTVDGVEQRSEELELGAFVNGECRGSARLLYIEPLDRYYAMMTVSGQDNEVVEFALIDMSHHQISTSSTTRLTFSNDAICGTYDNPYTVAFGTMTAIEEHTSSMYLYPNPINRFDTFNLVIPEDEEIVELTVVDASGAVVRRETGAIKRHAVTGLSVTGLYMVRVVCKSGNVYHGRLIVR